jgi:hypothetical protein
MNRPSKVPLLTKEGPGEVWNAAVLNLPLAPSLVRRGFIDPTYPCPTGRSLRVSGKVLLKWINNRSPELVEG